MTSSNCWLKWDRSSSRPHPTCSWAAHPWPHEFRAIASSIPISEPTPIAGGTVVASATSFWHDPQCHTTVGTAIATMRIPGDNCLAPHRLSVVHVPHKPPVESDPRSAGRSLDSRCNNRPSTCPQRRPRTDPGVPLPTHCEVKDIQRHRHPPISPHPRRHARLGFPQRFTRHFVNPSRLGIVLDHLGNGLGQQQCHPCVSGPDQTILKHRLPEIVNQQCQQRCRGGLDVQ